MQAYRIRTESRISPFNDHPGECLIANRKLRDHQDVAIRRAGLDLIDVSSPSEIESGERVVFRDHTYFSLGLLSDFISRSRSTGAPCSCHLKRGVCTKRTMVETMDVDHLDSSIRYRLDYYPGGEDGGMTREDVVVDPDESVLKMSFPEHMIPKGVYEIPMSTRQLVQVEHWTNLWAANMMSILSRPQELRASKGRLFIKALRAMSTNQWKVSSKNVVVGEGCDIHPTAYIENSILGDGVEVGAGSVIRLADIGDDAVIANNANVLCSVMGGGSQIRDGCNLQFSVLYPGAFLSMRFMNASFAGRDSFIGDGVSLADFRFDGRSARVQMKGEKIDTEAYFLGPCIGHNTYLGSGVVVGPGKEVPNNVRISPGKSRVITNERIDGDFHVLRESGEEIRREYVR